MKGQSAEFNSNIEAKKETLIIDPYLLLQEEPTPVIQKEINSLTEEIEDVENRIEALSIRNSTLIDEIVTLETRCSAILIRQQQTNDELQKERGQLRSLIGMSESLQEVIDARANEHELDNPSEKTPANNPDGILNISHEN